MSKKKKQSDHYQPPPALGRDWGFYRPVGVVRAKRMEEPFAIAGADGKDQKGKAGDYVLIDMDGQVALADGEMFALAFVPVGPAKLEKLPYQDWSVVQP